MMRLHTSFQWWGDIFSCVCSCYACATRRLPTEELVAWTVFNAGFSMASVMLGYATVWYPLYLLNSRSATPNQPGLA
jgi:hypothetical protein